MEILIKTMALDGTVAWAVFSAVLMVVCMLGFANDGSRRLDWFLLTLLTGCQTVFAGLLVFVQIRQRFALLVPEIYKKGFDVFFQMCSDAVSFLLWIPILYIVGKAVIAAFTVRFKEKKNLSGCCEAFVLQIYESMEKTGHFFTSLRRMELGAEEKRPCGN